MNQVAITKYCKVYFNAILRVFCQFLQKTGDPIVLRYTEHQKRPAAFEELGRSLQLVRKALDSYNAKVPCIIYYVAPERKSIRNIDITHELF